MTSYRGDDIRPQSIVVDDLMQHGYSYQLTEPAGVVWKNEIIPASA